MKEVHDIEIPYLVRFVWASSAAKEVWEKKIVEARGYLASRLPALLVEHGIAPFAPAADPSLIMEPVGRAVITNHYPTRWSTHRSALSSHPGLLKEVGVIGRFNRDSYSLNGRWDILRDLYQIALAPDCCKKAYFDSPYRDPYHHLYEAAPGRIKKLESHKINSLLSPFGLFISPIVPCSLNCQHAIDKASEIDLLISRDNPVVYETLKTVTEMPLRIDSYRGMACVDTPMFKGVFSTDVYKNKYVLDVKPIGAESFSYEQDWVARGASFPFKGIFSGGI